MTETTHIDADQQPEDDLPIIFRMPLELRWRDLDAFNHAFIEKLANWRFAEAQYEAARKGESGWSFPT